MSYSYNKKKKKDDGKLKVFGAIVVLGALGVGGFAIAGGIKGKITKMKIEEKNSTKYVYQEGKTSIYECQGIITDDDLNNLPSSIKSISLRDCHYVTDMSQIPYKCPNVENLSLSNCSGISDLSFITRFNNLKRVHLNDMVGISPELLEYLEEKEIEYDIADDDIKASGEVDRIVREIIKDDMNDDQKIRAVCIYVSEHCDYVKSTGEKANENPLTTSVNDGKTVCAGYAYMTNVLLRKAGIKSYEVTNANHAWNLVDKDGKYYYVDTTNLGGMILPPNAARAVVEKFGMADGFMVSPKSEALSAMSPYDKQDKVVIPPSLIEDIKKGETEKQLLDKYGNTAPAHLIELLIAMVGMAVGTKMAVSVVEKVIDR